MIRRGDAVRFDGVVWDVWDEAPRTREAWDRGRKYEGRYWWISRWLDDSGSCLVVAVPEPCLDPVVEQLTL